MSLHPCGNLRDALLIIALDLQHIHFVFDKVERLEKHKLGPFRVHRHVPDVHDFVCVEKRRERQALDRLLSEHFGTTCNAFEVCVLCDSVETLQGQVEDHRRASFGRIADGARVRVGAARGYRLNRLDADALDKMGTKVFGA
jgi:hypothetical protein